MLLSKTCARTPRTSLFFPDRLLQNVVARRMCHTASFVRQTRKESCQSLKSHGHLLPKWTVHELPSHSVLQFQVRYATKARAGATRNVSRSVGDRLGLKANHGQFINAGSIIIRQRGFRILHPGSNVVVGRQYTLHAKIDGYVMFTKDSNNCKMKERTICSILPAKEYERWLAIKKKEVAKVRHRPMDLIDITKLPTLMPETGAWYNSRAEFWAKKATQTDYIIQQLNALGLKPNDTTLPEQYDRDPQLQPRLHVSDEPLPFMYRNGAKTECLQVDASRISDDVDVSNRSGESRNLVETKANSAVSATELST